MEALGALGDMLGRVFAGMPVWGWIAIAGGIILLFVFRGRLTNLFGGQSSAASDASNQAGTSNSNLNPNLDPNTGVPYSIESTVNPNTGLPAYYGGAGVTTQNPPPGQADLSQIQAALTQISQQIATQNPSGQGGVTPVTGGGSTGDGRSTPPSSQTTYTIRASGSVPDYASYDVAHPQGVPIESQPGLGGYVGYLPFGSAVVPTGQIIQGSTNTGRAGGATGYYPVQGGYVSAADIVSSTRLIPGTPVDPSRTGVLSKA